VAGAEAGRSETGSPGKYPKMYFPLNDSYHQNVEGMKIHEEKKTQHNHPPSKDASINKEAPVKN
jgi:hypothetical protein